MMMLRRLLIEKMEWGRDAGKLMGTITFEGTEAVTSLKLTEANSLKMLEIVSDQLVDNARAIGAVLLSDILTPAPLEIEAEKS